MADKVMSFEKIDALMQKVDLDAYKPGGSLYVPAKVVKANPAAALPQFCPIYKALLPILVAISEIIFIPKKWRDVIKKAIAILDTLCP